MLLEFILATIWLLIVTFALGYALTREYNLMSIGFGLAAFCVISMIFNLLHIPLNWMLFLGMAIAILAYFLFTNKLKLSIPHPDSITLVVLLLSAFNFYIYWQGSMAYPYLEDDDSWKHAIGATQVARTGSFSRYFNGVDFARIYLEPYPPAYDVLMGIIHQMTPSVSNTLKFFNAFLVAIGLIFAFYCIAELTKNRRLAVFATFFLFAIPAFMSHFIWAQTLAVILMFVAFYAYKKALTDNKFVMPGGIAVAAIAVTQPSIAAIFAMLSIIYTLTEYYAGGIKALKPLVLIGIIGILLASTYWIPTVLKYGVTYTMEGIGINIGSTNNNYFGDTNLGRTYSIEDYLFVQPTGFIDQQIGVGWALMLLAVLGAGFCISELIKGKKDAYLSFSVIMLVFGFLGTEGNALPVYFRLFPYRFWIFLAIPVAILSAYAYIKWEEWQPKYSGISLIILISLVLISSAMNKFAVQMSVWPPGTGYSSGQELGGYLYMKSSLSENTKVFPLCQETSILLVDSEDSKVIGNDMLSEPWVPEYEAFKRTATNATPSEVYAFLKSRSYNYLTIDSTCVTTLGLNETNRVVSDYLNSTNEYEPVFSNGGFILLHLKGAGT